MKRGILFVFVFAVFSFVFYIRGCVFLDFVEFKALDYQFHIRGSVEVGSPPVVIVAVDEKSIKELGRWPWTRKIIAKGIEQLFKMGASVVGLDIVFSESESVQQREMIEETLGEIMKERVKEILRNLNFDKPLIDVVSRYKQRLVLGYFFDFEGGNTQGVDTFIKKSQVGVVIKRPPDSPIYLLDAKGVNANIPQIEREAEHFGFFNAKGDRDGIYRRAILFAQFNGKIYPSLPLEMIRVYTHSEIILYVEEGFVTQMRIGDLSIPLSGRGEILLNFLGRKRTFPHYSFVDVLKGRVDAEKIKGKVVLIGATAVGIYDVRPTPVDETYPGVEIHATVIDNILKKRFIKRPDWLWFFELVALWVIFGISGFAFFRGGPLKSIFVSILPLVLFNAGAFIAFKFFNLWIKVVYPDIASLLLILILAFYRYFKEERMKRRIRTAFEHYLNEDLVEIVVSNPDKLKLGGEKREVTILFSDIRDFTALSEELSAEEVAEFLHRYLTPMTNVILEQKGLLDKYIGDAIMAIFGAPVFIEDHAKRACLTALRMMEVLNEFNRESKWKKINIGIGINTGMCIVGNMGSDVLFDYTAIGDPVNLASRLEGATKLYGVNIVVSEFTVNHVKDHDFFFRELDYVRVKGKKKPVRIFQLVGFKEMINTEMKEMCEEFERGLYLYREGRWDECIEVFKKCIERIPVDVPSRVFLERSVKLKKLNPSAWDGVFEMEAK